MDSRGKGESSGPRGDSSGPRERRTVVEAIEEIGYGCGQLSFNALVNGTWLADGSEALAISSLTNTLATEWHLSKGMQGSLVSVVYAGTFVGSILSGALGDAYGRRLPIIICYPVIAAFSVCSGCANQLWSLFLLRFFVGVGFGVGQPNSVAILVEVSPVRWRTVNQGFAQVAFAMGELFCCFILWMDDPSLADLHWRWVLIAGAIPAAAFWVLSWVFLDESPAYLVQRDTAAAGRVLQKLGTANGRLQASYELVPSRAGPESTRGLQSLAHGSLLQRTLVLGFICFSYNLTTYGAFYAMPKILPSSNVGMSAVSALTFGALIEIPFDVAGVLASMILLRRTSLAASFVGVFVSLVLFSISSATGEGNAIALKIGYYGLKGFPQISSLVLYVFASEAYPVAVRSTGTAIVLGVGRLGAIVSSMVYELLETVSGGHTAFFTTAAALIIMSAAMVFTLPETREGPDAEGMAPDERSPLLAKVLERDAGSCRLEASAR